MSNDVRSLVVVIGVLALGGGPGARAQEGETVRKEDPLLEPLPVFKAGVPGLEGLVVKEALVQAPVAAEGTAQPGRPSEEDRLRDELRRLKEKDRLGAIPRFADDLFELRRDSASTTDGGVAEDYVLGAGDRLLLHVVGGTPMETPLVVDGRGMLSLPRVGPLKVRGMTLARAKAAAQALVNQSFGHSKVELQVTGLREIRISILGEVYQPGSYLVSSMASIVNVLSLAGGPTLKGSLREIRVMRGGERVVQLDLYPLRAEGRGNPDVTLESGDVVFVPLARCMVNLEGAFLRLGATADPGPAAGEAGQKEAEAQQGRAALRTHAAQENWFAPGGGPPPAMAFELLAGEGMPALLAFAGGLLPEWSSGVLSLRRRNALGVVEIRSFGAGDADLGALALQRGDVLSALPSRERDEKLVTLGGWVRVQGPFARTEGLKVGALLKRDGQVLPDSYLARGEILRTEPDGTTRYLVFSVAEALKGNPAHDLLLENRDRIQVFSAESLRQRERVKVVGPVTHPGEFKFHPGMRASDLVFLAGVPLRSANRLVVELARTGKGLPSSIRRLELGCLLSDEAGSPVALTDEARNPLLEPDDQLAFFEKPGFKVHRVVRISGMVAMPGSYVLDEKKFMLSHLIARAGGLTPEAMLRAGILLRNLGGSSSLRGAPSATVNPRGVDEILDRLSEVKRQPTTGQLLRTPLLHGLAEGRLNRMVVDFPKAVQGDPGADVELQDGDEVILPEKSEAAFVVGETASPFGTYKLVAGMRVKDLLDLAGGTTRNADTSNIRLLKANGQIQDHGVRGLGVEPGDTVLVPQRIRRDTSWQENLAALTPLALILNAVWRRD